jgi:hypothetical protein
MKEECRKELKKLIKKLKERNKLLIDGLMEDFKKGYMSPEQLFNAYATHIELLLESMEKEMKK